MNDLTALFTSLKPLLEACAPPFVGRSQGPDDYHLWSEKSVFFSGQQRSELYFAGLVIRKGYVAFYYMPVYARKEIKSSFSPRLLGLMTGKSCFHIKRLDDALAGDIRQALDVGVEAYRQLGWV